MAATSTFPYVIVNAFTDSAFGGNPAAIVLLPPGSLIADRMLLNASKMTSIARSFAQPTTVFLSSSIHTELPDSDETRVYDILFVLDKYFTPLCGHGTLAATKAICRGMFPGVSQGVANPVVKFRTPDDTIVCARAMDPGNRDSTADGEFYELTIPVAAMQQVTEAERCDIRNMLGKVLGKDANNVGLKYVAHEVSDTTSYDRLVMVLDQSEKLEGRNVDINAFVSQFEAVLLNPSWDDVFHVAYRTL